MKIDTPGKDQISDLRNLWKEAFGDSDEFLDTFFRTAFAKNRCRCLSMDGRVVAALYWFDCGFAEEAVLTKELKAASVEKIAYIYAVATAEEFRGKGLCHKLMADTHRYLTSEGYEGAILVPGSKELFRFYNNIGYKTCSTVKEFSCQSSRNKISIRQISKEEYAKLRRKFLPQNSVIQEKENLDFLMAQAKVYAGEDFLLVGQKEETQDGVFRGIELLGNTDRAPAILHALGCKEGRFRSPGEDKPFAMYYPFKKIVRMPSYFGLPFD